MIHRGPYFAYRALSWLTYRIPRRFTRAGLGVLLALAIAAITGIDTENLMVYQAFPVLLFLVLASMLWTPFFRARFDVTRSLPTFGTVGQPVRYRVAVTNRTRKPQSGIDYLEDLADPRPGLNDWWAVQKAEMKRVKFFRFRGRRDRSPFRLATVSAPPVPPLPPGQSAEVAVELLPLRRGVLRFSGATLARPDPLGLCRAFSSVSQPESMLILPRRYPLPPLALPGLVKYQEGGVALASSVGQSEEFVSLRDYRRGDPIRHIHWRSWAKAGKPIVKEFEDEFFVRHALVLDTFTSDPWSDAFEEAVSIAASFACTILTQESLLDLLFVGPQAYCFTAGRGLAHTEQILEILASVRPCVNRPFETLSGLVQQQAAAVSGCICVFLEWDEARQDLVRRLRKMGVPVWVLVLAEPERAEQLDPGPLREERDRFHPLKIGHIAEGLAALA
ncbi:MAG: DUF58 domain-containing protein [Verrucomicrobiota bacterium]